MIGGTLCHGGDLSGQDERPPTWETVKSRKGTETDDETTRPASTPNVTGKSHLQAWLDVRGFTSAQLERASHVGRQQMTKIRLRDTDVRRKTMIKICRGASLLAGETVRMDELFDLDPYSPENLRLIPMESVC